MKKGRRRRSEEKRRWSGTQRRREERRQSLPPRRRKHGEREIGGLGEAELVWALKFPADGYLLSCGSTQNDEEGPLTYVPDDNYTSAGNKTSLKRTDILPRLQTLRFFPNANARKHCYTFPVTKEKKYLVKTVYFYGGFDGGTEPPVFDQIIDGSKWSTVNTTEDYANGGSSYYEAVVVAQNKFLSVCLARNEHTSNGSSPFISSLEVYFLDDSVYNSTDFEKNMMANVARSSFGPEGDIICFPDDKFDRYWQTFRDGYPFVLSQSNATPSTFWNIPPQSALSSALTTSRGKNLTFNWPPFSLPSGLYYIALYFQDNRHASPYSWRVFDVYINGGKFFQALNVTAEGQSVVGTKWPLQGITEISLVPNGDSRVGPLINAGEIFRVLPVQGKTVTRDVMVIEDLREAIANNPPEGWAGDPCLPKGTSWIGVSCSDNDPFRIISLNLTGFGLTGPLPESLSHLTALKHLLLGDNKVSGTIPDLSALKSLEILHLENNQLEGSIPSSLGELPNLKEVFLQNNKLDSKIPDSLKNKEGLTIRL